MSTPNEQSIHVGGFPPENFDWYAVQKTITNHTAVRNAIKALAGISIDSRDNNAADLAPDDVMSKIVDEATEAIVDVMNQHGLKVCQPQMLQKRLTDPKYPCWQYDPKSVLRYPCHTETCPFAIWHAKNNQTPNTLPLDEEDKELLS